MLRMADDETRPRSRPSSLAALEARLNGTRSVPRWDRGAGKGYGSGKVFGHHRGSGGGGGKGGGGRDGGGIDCGGGGKGGQGGRGRSCVCVLDALPPGTSLLGDACSPSSMSATLAKRGCLCAAFVTMPNVKAGTPSSWRGSQIVKAVCSLWLAS